MKNSGKKFEEAFAKSIPDYCFCYRLHDPPQSFHQSENLRFSWKNPCDFFLFDNKNRFLLALELKSTKSKSISFEDIKIDGKQPSRMIHKHQIKDLGDYDDNNEFVIGGFLFNFRTEEIGSERTYFQSISDFINMTNKLGKKSFNEMDLLQSNYIKINGQKKRVNYVWDIDDLLNQLSQQLITKMEVKI